MHNNELRSHIQKALHAIESGHDIDRMGVGAVLASVMGHPPAEEEVDAAITQLRMIPPLLSMEERLEVVLESLDQVSGELPFLQEQQSRVDEMFRAASVSSPFSLAVRHDFGVLSPKHEACLVKAIQNHQLTRAEALACINDGERLTHHLDGINHVTIPLIFRTTDHNGMPQITREMDAVVFQEAVSIETPGATFLVAVSNESELRQVALPEGDTVDWLKRTITAESVLYDVGANVGFYSLYAASLHPNAKAIAFEPAPLNVSRLNANIHLNNLGARIMAFPIALSDKTGIAKFGNSYFVSGGWSHRGIDPRKNTPGETFFSGCVRYTLDDLLRSADFIPPPTHLKVDVDGPELEVLRGAVDTLKRPGLRHLLVEMREDQEVMMAETMLEKAGFRLQGARMHGLGNRIFERVDG